MSEGGSTATPRPYEEGGVINVLKNTIGPSLVSSNGDGLYVTNDPEGPRRIATGEDRYWVSLSPGLYTAPGGTTPEGYPCHWQWGSPTIARGGRGDINPVVEILASDKVFITSNCGNWKRLPDASPEPTSVYFTPGGPYGKPDHLRMDHTFSIPKIYVGSSAGSGFIFDVIDNTAFVVTNYHVIKNGLDNPVLVDLGGIVPYEALILGWDSVKDVALISICCSDYFKAISWETTAPKVGDQVVAIGYPTSGGWGDAVVTIGEITMADSSSSLYATISHSASLNPGNSGGPLFSMPHGKILGVNTLRGGLLEMANYAVPVWAIRSQLEEWRDRLNDPK